MEETVLSRISPQYFSESPSRSGLCGGAGGSEDRELQQPDDFSKGSSGSLLQQNWE